MSKAFNKGMDRYMGRRKGFKPRRYNSESWLDKLKAFHAKIISFFKQEQSVDLNRLESAGVTIVDETDTPARKIMKNIKKKEQPTQPINEDIDPAIIAQIMKQNKLK